MNDDEFFQAYQSLLENDSQVTIPIDTQLGDTIPDKPYIANAIHVVVLNRRIDDYIKPAITTLIEALANQAYTRRSQPIFNGNKITMFGLRERIA